MIWSNKEKEELLRHYAKYKDDMPWELLRKNFKNRSVKALQSKLRDLKNIEEQFTLDWSTSMTKLAFQMYVSGSKLTEIRTALKEQEEVVVAVPVIKARMLETKSKWEDYFDKLVGSPQKYTLEMIKELIEWQEDGRKTKMPYFSS
jgi:precorrin isomerase